MLVLVGNLHARKRAIVRENVLYKPMAMHLAPPGEVVTLDIATSGGTAWDCILKTGFRFQAGKPMPSAAIACDAHRVGGDADLGRAPRISLSSLWKPERNGDYDGVFRLGKVSASPPEVSGKASR